MPVFSLHKNNNILAIALTQTSRHPKTGLINLGISGGDAGGLIQMPIFVFLCLLTSLGILVLGLLSVPNFFSDSVLPTEITKYILTTLPFVFGVIYSVRVINRTLRVHTTYHWNPMRITWKWYVVVGAWLCLLLSVLFFTARDQNEQWDFYLVLATLVAVGFVLAGLKKIPSANLVLLCAASIQSIALLISYALVFLIGLGKNPQSELGWKVPVLLATTGVFTLTVWYALLSPYQSQKAD